MSRVLATALVALALLYAPSELAAFHGGQSFASSANSGGGGGIYFSGAPRWKRYDCSICHVDPAGMVSLRVSSEPPELVDDGVWTPGARYLITLELEGETRGLDSASNINTAIAEFVDDSGDAVGRFVVGGAGGSGGADGDGGELALFDQDRVLSTRGQEGRNRWQFRYQAPMTSGGAITLYAAAVDGDGAGNPNERKADALGDDTAVLRRRICERDVPCEVGPSAAPEVFDSPAAAGCGLGESHRPGSTPWLLLIGVAVAIRRSSR